MFKKMITSLIVLALVCSASLGQPNIGTNYHEIQIVDEEGVNVTEITSVSIYNPGTTTEATIYAGRNNTLSMTNPVTTSSTNTTLSNGYMYWWGPGNYDFSMTDGTNVHTNSGHRDRTPSEGHITFPSFLSSTNTTTYTDAQTATFGTGADWVLRGGLTADTFEFVPASDNSNFIIGVSGTTLNSDFNVYVGTALGLKLDAGTPSLAWDGGAATINHNSNFNAALCSGTSTGTVTLGNSAAGAIVFDTTDTLTSSSDGATSITTTDASADITVDATAGSVIIDGGEAIADAVTIRATGAAGGIDITSLADIDITTTGAAAEDISITNTGGSVIITATEAVADAIVISASTALGGIDITSNADIDITTTGAAGEDITITNTGGSITITATEAIADALTIGTSAAGGDLNLDSVLGRIEIEAEEDAANAVYIIADGGTSSTINIFNDTGTGDESVKLSTDVGGITLNAAAGSIDIEAVGATDGDIILNAGDDMTLTVAGDLTLGVTGATNLGNNQLRRVVKEITAVQLDNLAATQIELVPSPGASAYLEFVSAVFALDWGTVAFTEPSAPDDLCIRYTDGSGAIVSELLDATGFATATGDVVVALNPVSDIQAGTTAKVAVAVAGCVNQALVLDNTGSEWTNSGDSVVQVVVYYRIHTTAELGL